MNKKLPIPVKRYIPPLIKFRFLAVLLSPNISLMASTKEIIINPDAKPLNKKAIDIETRLLVEGINKADIVDSISKIAEAYTPSLLVFSSVFIGL